MAKRFPPLDDRGPLRVLFVITSMPVGGAETLLVNLIRRLDRDCFSPEICCLKELGPLGELMAAEVPVHTGLLRSKFDLRVLPKLVHLMRERRIDAVVTVGAGDKMFWGRLAARLAGVPVVISALHSTGWPDCIGRLNRMLTPLTSAFVGVAAAHGRYLVETERFPADKVHVIPNGVDIGRFAPRPASGQLRAELGLRETGPIAIIVAALRPEKNHALFLQVAARAGQQVPEAQFLIVGDGPCRADLETLAAELHLTESVCFAGNRTDIAALLALSNVFVLTSHMEANPVSILEAMATGLPVVATNVGSISDSVQTENTGYLVPAGDGDQLAERLAYLLQHPSEARQMGQAGRQRVVQNWSLERMVHGYEDLITLLYRQKVAGPPVAGRCSSATLAPPPSPAEQK
jgi:glycosyltransferase involved in cell wall biosynthesis